MGTHDPVTEHGRLFTRVVRCCNVKLFALLYSENLTTETYERLVADMLRFKETIKEYPRQK